MDPADLLYGDLRRIEHYFVQIGSPSRRLDLVGKIKLSWNPSAEIKAKGKDTKPSLYEKIERVERYLDEQSQLHFARPESRYDEVDFVQETCRAVKIEIPAQRGTDPSKKMTLWISHPESADGKAGILVLVQDFNYPDEKPTSFKNASTFSVLAALVHNTRKEIDGSVLGNMVPKLPRNHPYIVFNTDTHPASLYEHQNVRDYIGEFGDNPVALLESWNCKVVSERRIRVLYKVREWGHEEANHWQKTTVFGYPIWIFASP